jgi:hypothetical protein
MNGKGSSPRNCFSARFKANFEAINWKSDGWRVTGCEKAGAKMKLNGNAATVKSRAQN